MFCRAGVFGKAESVTDGDRAAILRVGLVFPARNAPRFLRL
jgi:hypothetical protein